MNKTSELLFFIHEQNISDQALLRIPYRETALSEIEFLTLILKDNSLHASDDVHRKSLFVIDNVGDLRACIAKHPEPFQGDFSCSLHKNGRYSCSTSGYTMKQCQFMQELDTLILDISFH